MSFSSTGDSEINSGLIVIGETVVTLHKETTEKVWETVGYGIPCLTADENNITVSITSIENGETLYKFILMSPEKYVVMEKHFHVITSTSSTDCLSADGNENCTEEISFGLNFAHEKVAERFHQAAVQLLPQPWQTKLSPDKRKLLHNLRSSTVSCTEEMIDFPPKILPVQCQTEEAGALTSSGKFPRMTLEESTVDEQSLHVLQVSYGGATGMTSEDEGQEDVDGKKLTKRSLRRQKGKKRTSKEWMGFSGRSFFDSEPSMRRRSESMGEIRISYPTEVRHLAHIHAGTPFHTLKEVVNTGISPTKCSDEKERDSKTKLYRTPSAPGRVRHSSLPPSDSFPAILVTPAKNPKLPLLPFRNFPKPPLPIPDFEDLLKQLEVSKEDERGLTNSTEAWQYSFHSAVGNLIHKKLIKEPLYSKLLSFTQSGREETSEKPSSRTGSVIIHDHGVISL